MRLLEAVQSLAIVELTAVSWINIRPAGEQYVASFTIALLLPFLDPGLSEEFLRGELRFWPDQERLLDSPIPLQDQILELHTTQILGNLASVYLVGKKGETAELWMVQTHAGSSEERMNWLRSVIPMEGRSPSV